MEQRADVLVIFGITGDLAKVMTFQSLHYLEQRGILDSWRGVSAVTGLPPPTSRR